MKKKKGQQFVLRRLLLELLTSLPPALLVNVIKTRYVEHMHQMSNTISNFSQHPIILQIEAF